MIIKSILIFCISFFSTNIVYACINTYGFNFFQGMMNQRNAEYLLKNQTVPIKTLEDLNDYGVLLIYARRIPEAIVIFQNIEKQHAGLAKTAANLGTAYELNGELTEAQYWIAQGMIRDPNIHRGSEWIHIKILEAKIQQQKDSHWIKQHDVLGLDFGHETAPKPQIEYILINQQSYDLKQIFKHAEIQMQQRLQFVSQDSVTAQVIFDMANIETWQMQQKEDAPLFLYQKAKDLGFLDQPLLEKRMDYVQNSRWYWLKRFIADIRSHFNIYILGERVENE